MAGASPSELAKKLADGLLYFPVTHFRGDLSLDEPGYRAHIDWLLDHRPAGLFAPGGAN